MNGISLNVRMTVTIPPSEKCRRLFVLIDQRIAEQKERRKRMTTAANKQSVKLRQMLLLCRSNENPCFDPALFSSSHFRSFIAPAKHPSKSQNVSPWRPSSVTTTAKAVASG